MLNQLEPWTDQSKRQAKEPVATCLKCKSTWFEQVDVNQYHANHSTILGQAVPLAGPQTFKILRCIKCSELYQPNVIITAQDSATKLYNSMLDQLEDKKVEEKV
jgi:predicted nucleic-acid-binding Zn-ribbon protein